MLLLLIGQVGVATSVATSAGEEARAGVLSVYCCIY